MTFEQWAEAVPGPWLRIGVERGWVVIPDDVRSANGEDD